MTYLSTGAGIAWRFAAGAASNAECQFIEKEHLLIGICSLEKAFVPGVLKEPLSPDVESSLRIEADAVDDMLRKFELDSTELRRAVRNALEKGNYQRTEEVIHRSEDCKSYFLRAGELAESVGAEGIDCTKLLVAILERPGKLITDVIGYFGADAEALKQRIVADAGEFLQGEGRMEEEKRGQQNEQPTGKEQKGSRPTPYLDRYGRDITKEAREGKIEPVVGRYDEILALVRTLSRKTKNNPVLIGDAGVGKTAIVEGLALRIVDVNRGDVVESIRDKQIVQLNMGALVGGTMYRGEFEQRLEGVIDEVRNNPDVILFIDEVHTIVGAGRGEGSLDAANILKPALGRGDIRCIAATTIDEYRRYIEKDSALERRFQPIIVNEPTVAQTKEILRNIKQRFEEHHKVTIADEAIEAAVELSAKYVPDRHFPDKAIDLIDEACSRARIKRVTMVPGMDISECGELEVTWDSAAEVVSEKTGIPIARLTGSERERLQRMVEELKAQVIGQDEAVEAVGRAIQRSRLMVRDTNRPIGVFFFAGPTGVGKTHLAKCLADFLFGSEKAMIRIDMSEYQEKHTVSRLVGAPPGYVGHEQEGHLTGPLRTRPFSLVLMDETEKAHPDVLNVFLQVFEDGRLTDGKGRTVDATNTIFIMTSNVRLETEHPIGYGRVRGIEEDVLRKALVKQGFRREFVNRLDKIILFRRLSVEDVEKIAKIFIAQLQERVKGVHIRVESDALRLLCEKGYDEENGARPLRRIIETEIEGALSDMLLAPEPDRVLCEGSIVRVSVMDGEIVVRVDPATE
jgi:ATP-dependent Clp protease ATP-binding subunit ClpC